MEDILNSAAGNSKANKLQPIGRTYLLEV
jgi:hypothetical protein